MAAHASMPLRLRDGTRVYYRALRPNDRDRYVAEVERMSAESRYARFLTSINHVTQDMVEQLVEDVDGVDHVAIVLLTEDDDVPVAIGRFIRNRAHRDRAEVAYAVADDWHRKGAGTIVVDALKGLAIERDVRYLTATVLYRNRASLRLMSRLGSTVSVTQIASGIVDVVVDLHGEPYTDDLSASGTDTDTDTHPDDGPGPGAGGAEPRAVDGGRLASHIRLLGWFGRDHTR